MKNILLIRIPSPVSEVQAETVVQWAQFSRSGDRFGEVHASSVNQLRQDWLSNQPVPDEEDELLPGQVVLLIPGGLALHKKVVLDSGQRKHINTALPYLVEEELAQDIESMHLSFHLHKRSNDVSLSIIPHADMQQLLVLFDQIGLSLDRVLAETQFIEPTPGFTALLLDAQSVLLSSPDHAGVCLDYDAIKFVLSEQKTTPADDSMLNELVGKNDQSHLSQIKLFYSECEFSPSAAQVEDLKVWLVEQGWLIDEILQPSSAFDYFASRYFVKRRAGELVDLRNGAYQSPRKAGREIRRWKPVVAVLVCWFVLEMGLASGQAFIYGQQSEELWNKTMTEYLQLFPNDQQAKSAMAKQQISFNVQRVLENRFRSAGSKQAGVPFLPLLQKVSIVSEELGTKAQLEPHSMEFNDSSGQLILEFQASSYESVDQFLAALQKSGLNTKLDSANQGKSGVIARMTISR